MKSLRPIHASGKAAAFQKLQQETRLTNKTPTKLIYYRLVLVTEQPPGMTTSHLVCESFTANHSSTWPNDAMYVK